MVKLSVNECSNQVSATVVSTNTSSDNLSVSSQNKSVAVSMTNSEAEYYSDLSKQSADSASESANSAKQYSEIAQTCSKSLQSDWSETDANSQGFIKNKPDVALQSHVTTLQLDLDNQLSTKVDKIQGKSLSTNDLTNELKYTYDNTAIIANDSANNDLSNLSDNAKIKLKNLMANSVNSGPVNSFGCPNVLSYSGKNLSIAKDTVITDYSKNTSKLTTVASLTTLNLLPNALYNLFLDKDGNLEFYTQAQCGKDFYCDFSQGKAIDNYGLNKITEIGAPNYTNNKFNSNGVTGLSLPITNFGTGPWCIQAKYTFTSLSNQVEIFDKMGQYLSLVLRRTTAGKLNLWMGTSGTAWDIVSQGVGSNVFANNIDYFIRLRFTGSQYLVDYSTDYNPTTQIGTWINDIAISSTAIVHNNQINLLFGYDLVEVNYPLVGTMNHLQITIGESVCRFRNKYQISNADLFPRSGDYLYNTSIEPCIMQKYDGFNYNPINKVFCGQFYTDSNSNIAGVFQPVFNQNNYDINTKYNIDSVIKVSSKTYIDYNAGVSIGFPTSNYFVGYDCVYVASFGLEKWFNTLYINNIASAFRIGNGAGYSDTSTVCIPLTVGQYFRWAGGPNYPQIGVLYPIKYVN